MDRHIPKRAPRLKTPRQAREARRGQENRGDGRTPDNDHTAPCTIAGAHGWPRQRRAWRTTHSRPSLHAGPHHTAGYPHSETPWGSDARVSGHRRPSPHPNSLRIAGGNTTPAVPFWPPATPYEPQKTQGAPIQTVLYTIPSPPPLCYLCSRTAPFGWHGKPSGYGRSSDEHYHPSSVEKSTEKRTLPRAPGANHPCADKCLARRVRCGRPLPYRRAPRQMAVRGLSPLGRLRVLARCRGTPTDARWPTCRRALTSVTPALLHGHGRCAGVAVPARPPPAHPAAWPSVPIKTTTTGGAAHTLPLWGKEEGRRGEVPATHRSGRGACRREKDVLSSGV